MCGGHVTHRATTCYHRVTIVLLSCYHTCYYEMHRDHIDFDVIPRVTIKI